MRAALTWLCWVAAAMPVATWASAPRIWYDDPALRSQLDQAIARFFGDARGPDIPLGDASNHMPRLARRFARVFDGVPGEERMLPDGDVLYAGCQPHNCGVAAAVVVGQGRQVIAAAVTHWHCGSRRLPAERPARPGRPGRIGDCDDPAFPTLAIIARGAGDTQAIAALERWGRLHLQPLRPRGVSLDYVRVTP